MNIIDLTHTIKENMPVFPGTKPPTLREANTISKDGFKETLITMYSHTGTHIDAPSHLIEGAPSLNELDVSHFIGKAFIFDFVNTGKKVIDQEDFEPFKKDIINSDFLIIKTNWDKYWGTEEYFAPFPYLSNKAAEWISTLDLKGVGIDTISIDDINSKNLPVHQYFLKNNFIIIENLTNLSKIKEKFFTISVLPLKTISADGSPVRAVAII